jgi:hypothetical protein
MPLASKHEPHKLDRRSTIKSAEMEYMMEYTMEYLMECMLECIMECMMECVALKSSEYGEQG